MLAVVAVVVVLTTRGRGGFDDTADSDKPSTTTAASTTAPTTNATAPTTAATTTTPATTSAAPSASPTPAVLGEPAGLLCRDLHARGHSYADAVVYWEHHGRPIVMDASGIDLPCLTVYPEVEVAAVWGEEKVNPRCPDAAALEAAFRQSDLSEAIVLGDGFVDIECAGTWGRALTTPGRMMVDQAEVYFRVACCPPAPRFVTGGTGIDCRDFIRPTERAYGEFCTV